MTELKNAQRTVKCPICKQPAAWQNNPYRPFCSQRCSLIDLGHWSDDRYSIEGDEKYSENETDY